MQRLKIQKEQVTPTYEEFVKTRIETKPYKETELLQVSVTGKSPEQAQEANQLLIDTFLKRLADIPC